MNAKILNRTRYIIPIIKFVKDNYYHPIKSIPFVMIKRLIEIVGWLGAFSLLFGYYLLQTERVDHKNTFYIALNIFGSLGLLINSAYNAAYPSAVTNLLWLLIGLYTGYYLFI